MKNEPITLTNVEIQKILPHRYPFLLIDKIVDFEEGKSITGIKNVTANEPQFTGHFPGNPNYAGRTYYRGTCTSRCCNAFVNARKQR